ncbi:MAG: toxin co-regulated pilus biosynthesis Q family protein, partial [Bilophila sp.]
EESDGSNSLLLQAQKSKASLPEEIWTLTPGSLQKQLEGWAGRAGYQLVWKSSSDLDMESRASFKGSFIGAIQQLFQGLHKSGHPLRVTLYQNNSVIEVSEK